MESGFVAHERQVVQRRMIFRGLIEDLGVEFFDDLITRADAAVAAGRKGITMPTEAGEERFAVAITDEIVSMRFLDGAVHAMSRAEAEDLLAQIVQEGSD